MLKELLLLPLCGPANSLLTVFIVTMIITVTLVITVIILITLVRNRASDINQWLPLEFLHSHINVSHSHSSLMELY